MTLFSCRKYNNFILIQEIFDKFWCECNGDKAALTAAAQADAQRLAQEKANAMECDCPEVKTWSASVSSGQFNSSYIPFTVTYNNPCGMSKIFTYDIYIMKDWDGPTTYEFYKTGTVSIPSGSGTFESQTEFLDEIREGYVEGSGSFDC
jgi:hypothetical protein